MNSLTGVLYKLRVHLEEHLVVLALLSFSNRGLIFGLVGLLPQDVALGSVMEHTLDNIVFLLKDAVLPRELDDVVGSLRVEGLEILDNGLVFLLLSEIFLVESGGVVLVDEEFVVLLVKVGHVLVDWALLCFLKDVSLNLNMKRRALKKPTATGLSSNRASKDVSPQR